MSKIVLDSEPNIPIECPFFDAKYVSCMVNVPHKCDGLFNREVRTFLGIFKFSRCPHCTTFDAEYAKMLKKHELQQ